MNINVLMIQDRWDGGTFCGAGQGALIRQELALIWRDLGICVIIAPEDPQDTLARAVLAVADAEQAARLAAEGLAKAREAVRQIEAEQAGIDAEVAEVAAREAEKAASLVPAEKPAGEAEAEAAVAEIAPMPAPGKVRR